MQEKSIPFNPMVRFCWSFALEIEGLADDWLLNHMAGMQIQYHENRTHISGKMKDISAVYGLIIGLRDMGISLLSLSITWIEQP